ncbi:MAG: acyltransferase [Pseudomonadota bacterium]
MRGADRLVGSVRLGAVSGDRDNNLNLIRMLAAAAVLVSHAYPITLGAGVREPLYGLIGLSLGKVAVYIFFGISGFLIAQSFERARSTGAFLAARGLRIFPGLIAVVALTALVLGPAVTTLPLGAYFTDPGLIGYVVRNITLASLQYDLPGVFADHPFPGVINGSLWTLFPELVCYALVLVVGLAGFLARGWRIWAVIAAYAVVCLAYYSVPALRMALPAPLAALLAKLLPLAFPFIIGMAFYVWRDSLPLGLLPGLGLIVLVVLLRDTALYYVAFDLALVYWTFLLGYLPGGVLRRYNRLGDYSYGFYIYAFPMQQLTLHVLGPHDPLTNMAFAIPTTLALAVLSWHLVEKPGLALRRRRTDRRERVAAPLRRVAGE